MFEKLRQKLKSIGHAKSTSENSETSVEPIKAVDGLGRDILINSDVWRDKVLGNEIQKKWSDPGALYGLILQAVNDRFHDDVLKASQHLVAIDQNKVRAISMRGIVLMKANNPNRLNGS